MRKHALVATLTALTALPAVLRAEESTLDTDPQLAARWTLDETDGTKAADVSKHAHHGTLQGGLTFKTASVPGRHGKALQFDGKKGFLEITGYKGITGTKARSAALWVKTKRNRGDLLSWGADDCGQMWILRFIRGRPGISPSGGYYYMNDYVHDDKWHHVAAVMTEGDPPNLHDNMALYLDGAPAKVHDIGLLDLWPLKTGSEIDVRIGKGFEGAVDDVRLYSRVLNREEVKALYDAK